MRSTLFIVPLFALSLGCSGNEEFKVAPVSGTVTLNGKPLKDATVTFQPMGLEKDLGPSSFGKTDAEGHYSLEVMTDGRTGAVIGQHKVLITLESDENQHDYENPDVNGAKNPNRKIPVRYNRESELTADVPAEGNEKLDFALKSP